MARTFEEQIPHTRKNTGYQYSVLTFEVFSIDANSHPELSTLIINEVSCFFFLLTERLSKARTFFTYLIH